MSVQIDIGFGRTIVGVGHELGVLRNQLAYMLATAYWETAQTLEPVKEAYWLSEGWREANLRYYPWYGRGFVQLTWEENYRRAQDELDLGTLLTDSPDEALDPYIAGKIMVMGMQQGWFTGKKLDDYITLQRSDFVSARRIINGTDRAAEIASIAEDYDDLLLAEGYGVDPAPVEPPDKPEPPVVDITLDKAKKAIVGLVQTVHSHEDRIAGLEAALGISKGVK